MFMVTAANVTFTDDVENATDNMLGGVSCDPDSPTTSKVGALWSS